MTFDTNFALPFDPTNANDTSAADAFVTFNYGWIGDPLVFGKYPDVMVEFAGDRLPKFTPEESEMLKGSWDYIGMNHYSTVYAKYNGV
mmetsp:Transcript_37798/g.33836  ORF Transcript_37798/g.33836 Transcript_37798/m.33836 type:complete len:88 (+) Transcript_37798:113-376(+)